MKEVLSITMWVNPEQLRQSQYILRIQIDEQVMSATTTTTALLGVLPKVYY